MAGAGIDRARRRGRHAQGFRARPAERLGPAARRGRRPAAAADRPHRHRACARLGRALGGNRTRRPVRRRRGRWRNLGPGPGDLKAGICATLAAARLARRAGLRLPREILFAFVGDEESGEPGSGVSAGMKAFVAEIESGAVPRPDIAVYVEPTELNVYAAQMGFLICDIAITGKSAYFGVPELGVDALKAGHAVLSALWAHSAKLEAQAPHPLVGRPFLLVTEAQAGGYIAVPGECRLSLILKLIPGQSLDDARAALEAAVRAAPVAAGVRIAFAYPAGRDHALRRHADETPETTPFVQALCAAVRAVRPDRGAIQGAPYWSEAPFLATRLGVPTVYCAPGDIRNCHTLEERVALRDYFDGIVAFAAFLGQLGEEAAR